MIRIRKLIFIAIACAISQASAQNGIGLQAGFLGTFTSVAEYPRIGRLDHLLDSMNIYSNVGSLQVAIQTEISLGKGIYLSPGFHYCQKGFAEVDFTDSTGYIWYTSARQHYGGLSVLIGYRFAIRNSQFGIQIATGPQIDFAIGAPNEGSLFSGPYSRFFMPFSRFNEVDVTWRAEFGVFYKLGPGAVGIKLNYQYGLSDVLEDPFVVARSQSAGFTAGYTLYLGNK